MRYRIELMTGLALLTGSVWAVEPPVRSLADLACYVDDPNPANPLQRLSPEARLALVRHAVAWTDQGHTQVVPILDDIFRELRPPQARAVLALFGMADALPGQPIEPYRMGAPCMPIANGVLAAARQPPAGEPATPPGCARAFLVNATADAKEQYGCWAQMAASGALRQLRLDTLMAARVVLANRANMEASAAATDALAIVVRELDRRPHQGEDAIGSLYGALLATGRPAEAEALVRAGAVPEVGPVLRRIPLGQRPPTQAARYWRTTTGQPVLTEQAVDLTRGLHLVIYMAPGCGFCHQAAREISGDPALRKLVRVRGHWIHVPSANHSLSYYDDWNHQHPDFAVDVVFDRRHWPTYNGLVPNVFILRDGQEVAQMRGWTKGSLAELRTQLQALGKLR